MFSLVSLEGSLGNLWNNQLTGSNLWGGVLCWGEVESFLGHWRSPFLNVLFRLGPFFQTGLAQELVGLARGEFLLCLGQGPYSFRTMSVLLGDLQYLLYACTVVCGHDKHLSRVSNIQAMYCSPRYSALASLDSSRYSLRSRACFVLANSSNIWQKSSPSSSVTAFRMAGNVVLGRACTRT